MNRPTIESTGTLYLVGTPIGNIGDLSPRAIEVLGQVDCIAAEDTRRTIGLLSRIGVKTPLIAYHDHNEETESEKLLEQLKAGRDIALVSDAGTPLISDPGWRLVSRATTAAISVLCVPGACAVTAALSVSGLPVDRFVFEGFLPRRKGQRAERLQWLVDEARTMVFFESVHRLQAMVDALVEHFGPDRKAAIARELTKLHEQTAYGTLATLAATIGTGIPLLGEFVVVVAGVESEVSAEAGQIHRIYRALRQELPPDTAVALCAQITGWSRNDVYALTRT